jgi:hypothetical protein
MTMMVMMVMMVMMLLLMFFARCKLIHLSVSNYVVMIRLELERTSQRKVKLLYKTFLNKSVSRDSFETLLSCSDSNILAFFLYKAGN